MFSDAAINKIKLVEATRSIYYLPLFAGLILSDAFFTIGGLLLSYRLADTIRSGSFKYTTQLLNRFIRIAPVYYLIVWFYTTYLEYLGDGPGWENAIHYNVDICRKNWIFNIFYVNNYINTWHICMVHTWFLAVDMQLFLLAPLALVPLYRWRNGRAVVLALLALSVALHVGTIIGARTTSVYRLQETDMALARMVLNHFSLQMHLIPFLIGIFYGYILNRTKNQNVTMHKVSVVAGWSVFAIMMAYIFLGLRHQLLDSYKYSAFDSAVYSVLSRLYMGIALSWLIFACHRGYGGWMNEFLSCYPFRVVSRLAYSANISHFIVLLHNTGRKRTPSWFDEYSQVQILIADFTIVMVISAILYVFVESPLFLVMQRLLPKSSSKNMQQSEGDSSGKSK